jgi:hypothetical protein
MNSNGQQLGVAIPGTSLCFLGRAPRRTISDRNIMGWYACSCGSRECREIISSRQADVNAGCTVSCGCVGKKQFKAHFEQRAANLPTATKTEIFRMTHEAKRIDRVSSFPGKRLRYIERQSQQAAAARFGLDRYVISFVVNRCCSFIRYAASCGKGGWNCLSKVERAWFRWQDLGNHLKKERAWKDSIQQQFESLPTIEKMKMLAEAKAAEAAQQEYNRQNPMSIADIQALLQDPLAEVEFHEYDILDAAMDQARAWTGC